MMQMMKSIQTRMDTNIEAVLTEDQKPGYEKYKEERNRKREERINSVPPGPRRNR